LTACQVLEDSLKNRTSKVATNSEKIARQVLESNPSLLKCLQSFLEN